MAGSSQEVGVGEKLNLSSSKRLTLVGIIAILLCVLILVVWRLQQYRWVDRSIITGVPCAPPCWQGITPGVTQMDEALEILSNSPYIETGSIKRAGTDISGGCTWRWRSPGRRMQPGLNWQTGIVDTIQMGLTFNLTVQEVTDKFGLPEAVSAVEGGQPEHWYWIIVLHYPSQGVEFKAYTSEFSKDIKPTTEVGAVLLFSPLTMDERIKEIEKGLSSPLPIDYFSDWKGYGDVAELYGGGRQWP